MASATPDLRIPSQQRSVTAFLAGTKLYCLVTEAHECEQLAQSCYLVADWPGVELTNFRSRSQANTLTTEPPNHQWGIIAVTERRTQLLGLHREIEATDGRRRRTVAATSGQVVDDQITPCAADVVTNNDCRPPGARHDDDDAHAPS